eukprot:1276557-Rhodomonas_salina.3
MPHMTGYEMCEQLRQIYPSNHLPVFTPQTFPSKSDEIYQKRIPPEEKGPDLCGVCLLYTSPSPRDRG